MAHVNINALRISNFIFYTTLLKTLWRLPQEIFHVYFDLSVSCAIWFMLELVFSLPFVSVLMLINHKKIIIFYYFLLINYVSWFWQFAHLSLSRFNREVESAISHNMIIMIKGARRAFQMSLLFFIRYLFFTQVNLRQHRYL